MAPNGSLYLPDLPKLFAGEELILSWHDVPIHTWNPAAIPESDATHWKDILNHERVRSQIHRTSPSFEPANPASQKQFEAATAAINVAPSQDKHYDISQIKADASWLSKDLKLDQAQALRVVLLEWQNRPLLHLQAGYSEAEVASLKDVYGSRLAFDANFEATTITLRDEEEFKTDSARRRRQIFIHYQECIGFSRTWLALQNDRLAVKLEIATEPNSTTPFPNIALSIDQSMDLLVKVLEEYAKGPEWDVIDEDSNYFWQIGHLFYAQNLMQVIILAIRTVPTPPAQPLQKWFHVMGDLVYLGDLEPSLLFTSNQLAQLHHLVALTTLAFIDPANTVHQLDQNPKQHWMDDLDIVSDVHMNLSNAIDASCLQAAPATYAWALVLQKARREAAETKDRRDSPIVNRTIETYDSATGRRASVPADTEKTCFEDICAAISAASPLPDAIGITLKYTVEKLKVADLLADMARFSGSDILPVVRLERQKLLQEVIVTSTSFLPLPETYGPNVLTPQLALLEPANPTPAARRETRDACTAFLNSDALVQDILDVAASRFPFEAIPFLRLCRHLAQVRVFQDNIQYITHRLQTLNYFTHNATGAFESYHTIREDENLNLVALDQHIYAFPAETSRMLTQGQHNQGALVIPADTQGEVISESDPPVVRWHFDYSGLQLIGDWLERYFNGVLSEVVSSHESPSDVAAEIIHLIANLLTTTALSKSALDNGSNEVDFIIQEASTSLNFRSSIINLVFDILEQELQAYRRRPTNTFDTDLLCACLAFSRAVLKVKPAQFWQLIAKTSVVDFHGGSGLLYSVISGVESTSGYTPVTESLCQLYEDMCVAAVQRLTSSNDNRQWRAGSSTNLLNNTEKIYEGVLRGVTQTMLEIFEVMTSWKRLPPGQEPRIIATLSDSFARVLRYRFGVGTAMSKLTACLNTAADLIMARIRPASVGDSKSGPIMSHLIDAVNLVPSLSSVAEVDACRASLLRLSKSIIDVAKFQEMPASGLEPTLLDLSPVLVRNIHAIGGDFHNLSCWLLQSLLESRFSEKPRSLLGHLGSASSIDFLDVLGMAQNANGRTAAQAWNLLNVMISKDQQWLSTVILTGSIPEKQGDAAKATTNVYRAKLVVDRAIDVLTNIESARTWTELYAVESVLKFMVAAQQNWSWTLHAMRSRQEIFAALIRYITNDRKEGSARAASERRTISALITDLASVHLQYAKSVRDLKLMKVFIPLLNWLTTNAIDVASYNTSLHANLAQNFASRFGLDLDDFKHNPLSSTADEDYYSLELADHVLEHSPAWKGQASGQSYRSEVERANENLRTVESELVLLHSFQHLCVEHAAFFVQDTGIQTTMAHISQRCLRANTNRYPAERLFDDLLQSRAEMALALIQRLVEKKCRGSDYRELLKSAWESALFMNASYEQAIANNDTTYWRTSLMVVLLAVQFHLGSGWKPLSSHAGNAHEIQKHQNSHVSQVIEIATVVIGQGLSTIVLTLQEQKQAEMQQRPPEKVDVGVKDITLILNFLETILRMATLPDFTSQLSERLIAMSTTESAMKLFMWSHLLASEDTDNDPVHAVYASRLLVALSTLPPVAEEMAVEGVLNQILTARVTQVLQKVPDGVMALDQRAHCGILYTIWAEGILPLALNLLDSVRAPVASEISVFVNSFPNQLVRASTAFRPREGEFITLGQAREVGTLSLLSFMLDDYRTAGASAAVDPASIMPLSGFDEHKKAMISDLRSHIELSKVALRSKIVPTNEKEMAWYNEMKEITVDGKKGVQCTLVEKVRGEMITSVSCLTASLGEDGGNEDGEGQGQEQR
ncbi:hypothetical protein OHC33_009212 [Knufia fluminis]|uniref:Nucleoporin NUP188 n=1 Tax=Knufia fluminis TaxID=191047 RepID=A0AAN8EES3_9EURO|nr:hypothetical protein OHC33_009212 [Knufia fluminis]